MQSIRQADAAPDEQPRERAGRHANQNPFRRAHLRHRVVFAPVLLRPGLAVPDNPLQRELRHLLHSWRADEVTYGIEGRAERQSLAEWIAFGW